MSENTKYNELKYLIAKMSFAITIYDFKNRIFSYNKILSDNVVDLIIEDLSNAKGEANQIKDKIYDKWVNKYLPPISGHISTIVEFLSDNYKSVFKIKIKLKKLKNITASNSDQSNDIENNNKEYTDLSNILKDNQSHNLELANSVKDKLNNDINIFMPAIESSEKFFINTYSNNTVIDNLLDNLSNDPNNNELKEKLQFAQNKASCFLELFEKIDNFTTEVKKAYNEIITSKKYYYYHNSVKTFYNEYNEKSDLCLAKGFDFPAPSDNITHPIYNVSRNEIINAFSQMYQIKSDLLGLTTEDAAV
jgi:hypothetical protein